MTTRAPKHHYGTGEEELDARIAELVAGRGYSEEETEVLQEMLTTCFRLARDRSHMGEMKLVNAALKEFAYAFKVFKPYRDRRKVSIFGSARTTPNDPAYDCARSLASAMAARGWMVITGAGPGIMAAGHEGAGADSSFGAGIRLPMEYEPNMFIEGDAKLINFKYFFTRKVTFLKESSAFALLPGGFGTLDEAFELLTLMQTGKSDIHPIVLIEQPGGTYWNDWLSFLHRHLADRGLINPQDLHLVRQVRTIDEAVEEILRFYYNYHSQRYLAGKLILRLQRLPPSEELDKLATAFADILRSPEMVEVNPTQREVDENDALDLNRLALDFNQSNFGRLRQFIDELNRF